MKYIAILLATYNSQRYLEQLIDSLLKQTVSNWVLYIRDDGSSDSTLNIIAKYLHNENVILLEDFHKKRGAKDSFIWLLKNVTADYYMFCDHDDIWLPNKIKLSYEKMINLELVNSNIPIIVHSDLIVVDENLHVISNSFWEYSKINPNFNTFDFLSAYNNITGCTMIINNFAKQVSLSIPNYAPMHDIWIALCVSFHNGTIGYIKEPQILYRQHTDNAIGAIEKVTHFDNLFKFKEVLKSNANLFKTVCYLRKISVVRFVANKLYYKTKLILST